MRTPESEVTGSTPVPTTCGDQVKHLVTDRFPAVPRNPATDREDKPATVWLTERW
jgi:hypothetical protein